MYIGEIGYRKVRDFNYEEDISSSAQLGDSTRADRDTVCCYHTFSLESVDNHPGP